MFTTKCFIRKNTPELRDKLKKLGYRVCICCEFKDNIWLNNFLTIKNDPSIHGIGVWDIEDSQEEALNLYITENASSLNPAIDCGDNEELFLALAALRDDTDKDQYFICDKVSFTLGKTYYPDDYLYYQYDEFFDKQNWHKATVEELVKFYNK